MSKKSMTLEEMRKDAEAAEAAAKAELEAATTAEPVASAPEPTPAPTPPPTPEPEKAPAPEPEKNAELESVKSELAEKQARIDELTKRVRDEDGKRGGELTALRQQIEGLGNQLRDLMTENRELRQRQPPPAPEKPPEPDALDTEYPDVANGINKRVMPIREAALRAEESAKMTMNELREVRLGRLFDAVTGAVPKWREYQNDPEFNQWANGRNPGMRAGETRDSVFKDCLRSYDPQPAIELFQQWADSKNKVVPPAEPPLNGKPKPPKPTKEEQVAPPASASASTPTSSTPSVAKMAARKLALEEKLYRFGTATKADREELERLYDAEVKDETTS